MTGDPVAKTLADIGRETGWKVDIVRSPAGALLIIDGDMVVGEVTEPTGERVMYDEPFPTAGLV